MSKEWILQEKETPRFYKKATWIPLRASMLNENGDCKKVGFKSEYFGCGSVAFPPEHRELVEDLDWSCLGIGREIVPYSYEDGYYSPVEEYEYSDKEPLGVNLIFDFPQPVSGNRKWIINPDLIIALRLVQENGKWIRPEEDFTEVIREHFDDKGNHTIIEIKKEYLLDYLSARNLNLRLSYYRQRVENVHSISQSIYNGLKNYREVRDDGEFELLVRDLESVYGGGFASFKVWRTDIDEEDDAPIMGEETNENTDYEQFTGYIRGEKGVRIEGEFWRNEWIENNSKSVRIRRDTDDMLPYFIVETDGSRMPSHDLNNEDVGRWLWFKSNIINELLSHRGFHLEWYTAKTGGIKSTSGYQIHFGINGEDLINVYAYDIARLNSWEQHLWSAQNVAPSGKVSDELLASQVKATPANTYAVEHILLEIMRLLERDFKRFYNIDLFNNEIDKDDYSKKIMRFNSQDTASLLRLAKDLVRYFSDRLNVKELRTVSTHPDKDKLGSNKLLQDIVSQKIGNEKAKEVMGVIFGVYDMRLGDAHPTSSQIQESLKLAKIDSSLSYLKQGEQLISNYGQAILQIGKLLFGEKPR